MDKSYSTFLMSQTAVAYDVIDKHEDYDVMWAEAQTLLTSFEASKFNTDSKSELDCMCDFIIDFKHRNDELKQTKLELVADRIVTELHQIALKYDADTYGLPLQHLESEMIQVVTKQLKTHLKIDDNGNLVTE